MGVFKFIVWTGFAVAIGVYLSTAPYPGGTPLQQATRYFEQQFPGHELDALTSDVKSAVDSATAKVTGETKPKERVTEGERAAVNKLIVKRSAAKQ